MKKILLIEDDPTIREMVEDYLGGEGYGVTAADTGEAAIERFGEEAFDLVLLDLMLPGMGGMAVLKAIRGVSVTPVIIVTAKDNDADKITGLNLGADDYVTKPFSILELAARIKANIRRQTQYSPSAEAADEAIAIKDLTINLTRHTVTRAGEDLRLTHTEFEILKLLAAHPGRAYSKEQIYSSIWREPYYGNENVLNAHINRLRGKLRPGEYIKTLWGIGYKMEE